jgi:DNA-binding MarR family transcriptional regulator
MLEREAGFQTEAETQCCGISLSQCHVLMELSDGKEMSIRDLSDLLGLDKSTLSRTVDKMVESGVLQRTVDREDRRFVSLCLTKKGRRNADSINGYCDEYYSRLFTLIPETKHDSIIESLSLLSDAMNRMRTEEKKSPFECCGK